MENEQYGVSEEIIQGNQWMDYSSFIDDDGGISCISFDDTHELIWTGRDSGRITSYLHSTGPEIVKYSSFMACKSPIVELLPSQQNILSMSADGIHMHAKGGLKLFSVNPSILENDGSNISLTCGVIFELSGGLVRGHDQYLFSGTSSNSSYVYDLNNTGAPLVTYDLEAGANCARSSVTFLTVGCADGKIRLLDPSLRSNAIQHTLDAHTGKVSCVSMLLDGTTMISCGLSGRPLNPYDSKSPITYHPDPLVRVFDMRMLRQVSPITLAIPPPSHVTMFPCAFPSPPDPSCSIAKATFLASSANGYMQSLSLSDNHEGILESMQVCYAALAGSADGSEVDKVTAMAASSTGRIAAVGSAMGALSLHALMDPMDENSMMDIKVNEASEDLQVPPSRPPPPPLSLGIDTPNLATSYILSTKLLTSEESQSLLSSFSSTPQWAKSHMKMKPRSKIAPELLSEANRKDYIETIQNKKGYPPNSLLCHKARGLAYAICDPRVILPPTAASVASRAQNARTYSVGSNSSNDSESMGRHSNGRANSDGDCKYPPSSYTRVKSHRGKHRMQRYNYAASNNTPFVGIENSTNNSWCNPVLQLLFAIPSIRESALSTQKSMYHNSNPNTLYGELGFLFDMMLAVFQSGERVKGVEFDTPMTAVDVVGGTQQVIVANRPKSVDPNAISRVVTPSNFQRVFQILSVGLFDNINKLRKAQDANLSPQQQSMKDPSLSPQTSHINDVTVVDARALQLHVQVFIKFILKQLLMEQEQEGRYSDNNSYECSIQQSFAFNLTSSSTFLQSNTTSPVSSLKGVSLDLSYPSPSLSCPSFSEILYRTLIQSSQMRGWCSASESYEPFKLTKRVVVSSLPNVLTLLCGDTLGTPASPYLGAKSSSSKSWNPDSLWHGKNSIGGSWLPVDIEVVYIPPTDKSGDNTEGRVYVSEKLASCDHPPVASSAASCNSSKGALEVVAEQPETPDTTAESGKETVDSTGSMENWLVFDGSTSNVLSAPASVYHTDCQDKVVVRLSLFGVISGVRSDGATHNSTCEPSSQSASSNFPSCHAVLHMRTKSCLSTPDPALAESEQNNDEWTLFNDFAISHCKIREVTMFPEWRIPCALFFARSDVSLWPDGSLLTSIKSTKRVPVPSNVLKLPSLSAVKCISPPPALIPPSPSTSSLSKSPMLVAFDAEFVSVEVEKVVIDARGQRIVKDEGRQVLARISLLDGTPAHCADGQSDMTVLADDYVLPSEPVVDYVTRFSGLTEEDLNPSASRHAVVHNRTAYLKLRYFRDAGCIFIGHGLQKDFETANLFVPPEQIRDTVELWRLPNQRKISLRFLASYLLKMEIQDDIHDSIEDARTALLLYRHYEEVKAKGPQCLQSTLNDLYAFGNSTNWTIGLDRLPESPVAPRKHPLGRGRGYLPDRGFQQQTHFPQYSMSRQGYIPGSMGHHGRGGGRGVMQQQYHYGNTQQHYGYPKYGGQNGSTY